MSTDKLTTLFQHTTAWAKSKGFNNPRAQYKKHIEEGGEVAAALCRNDQAKLKDGLGDVCITTTATATSANINIAAEIVATGQRLQLGNTLDEIVATLKTAGDAESFTVDTLFEILQARNGRLGEALSTANLRALPDILVEVFFGVALLAHACNMDIVDCFQFAWDQVSQRQGKVIDGVFVKKEDLPKHVVAV